MGESATTTDGDQADIGVHTNVEQDASAAGVTASAADRKAPSNQGSVSNETGNAEKGERRKGVWRRIWDLINWVPPSCRYDPDHPLHLTMSLNILFGVACTFTVANLYYSHPLLDIIAKAFNVSGERASIVPTCAQAGYAAGLLFLCPLGDIVKRRPFILALMAVTATISLGLCITNSFGAFVAINFIVGVTTVTPQLMLPLVGELAKPNRRATAISIVVSGLLLGILIARLISGVIAAYSSWRNVYWMSFALQYVILILLWLYLPDYPQTNKNISYFRILWSILEYVVSEPLLVQACLMAFFIGATFTSFWTTLTFLLSGAPYHYSTIVIGLFALAGIVPMGFGPFFARHFIDRFHTHASALFGMIFCLVGIAVGAYIGTFTVAGPILQAIVFDFGQQITQIANRTAIFAVAPKASNRINTAYMVSVFSGQLMGTAVGNGLYAQGGWIRSGSSNVGFMGAAILILLLRGPHETRWIGWRGGFDVRKKRQMDQQPAGRAPSQSPDGQQGSGEVDIEKEAAPKNSLPVGREEKTVIDMPDSAEDREEREKDIENA